MPREYGKDQGLDEEWALSLRPRSPPPQHSRGTKRVARSASPQTLSEKRARSVGITAGNAFRAEVGSMAEKVRRTSEDARRGVEAPEKGEEGRKAENGGVLKGWRRQSAWKRPGTGRRRRTSSRRWRTRRPGAR